ncbi:hypothetical protein CF67_11018 [Candidatus Photodesmus blepharus]|uniref:Lipoprotein n=1 Tax=Candidatus Photodesmus blepharonis TaxID=1179155 RepID=A0A084CPB0_9GAMM|nr:type II secretion system pilot lipoprotein GspS-beta [Candidatus Photodesmus blepharus]KEY91639.1 hypothetical protein CF67_11018 [Candidatus Photodesmus blepharus]
MNKKRVALLSLALLTACSLSSNNQTQLELIAENRANLLNSKLPLERGLLSIMHVVAKKTTIEISILYNKDVKNTGTLNKILNVSTRNYCQNPDIKKNLNVGIKYLIKIHNNRGRLITEQHIDQNSCS